MKIASERVGAFRYNWQVWGDCGRVLAHGHARTVVGARLRAAFERTRLEPSELTTLDWCGERHQPRTPPRH